MQSARVKNSQAISLQRLTMGFMNYESARRLYSGKARLTSDSELVPQKPQKSMNLFDHFNLKPKLNLQLKGGEKREPEVQRLKKPSVQCISHVLC